MIEKIPGTVVIPTELGFGVFVMILGTGVASWVRLNTRVARLEEQLKHQGQVFDKVSSQMQALTLVLESLKTDINWIKDAIANKE